MLTTFISNFKFNAVISTVIRATVPFTTLKRAAFLFRTVRADTAEHPELFSLMEFGPHIRLAHRARLICSCNESLDLDWGPLLV